MGLVQSLPSRRLDTEPPRLGADRVRRSAETKPDDLRMDAGDAPGDQTHRIEHRPCAPPRLPQWSIVRHGQAKANEVPIKRRPRQVEKKTKRLNALTGGNHAGQDLIEGEDSSGGQRKQQRRRPRNRGAPLLRCSR